MSGLALPAHVAARRNRQIDTHRAIASNADDYVSRSDVEAQLAALPVELLPEGPAGHRIMVMACLWPEKAGNLIVATDQTREAQALASPQGVVLKLGISAYKDPDRYPEGPWCQPGDRIIFQKYGGRLWKLSTGQMIAFLNDDEVAGIIDSGYDVPGAPA